MTSPLISAALALLFGAAMGVAVNRLLRLRAAEAPGSRDPGTLPRPPAPLLLNPWLHAAVLGAASAALALLPPLRAPHALAQALLLLYLLYPLALVDVLSLTIEPGLVVGGMVLRLVAVGLFDPGALLEAVGGLLGGAGLLTVIAFTYQWIRQQDGLGEGDPLVLGLVGAFVGWGGLLPALLAAAVAGLLVGFPALLLLRKPLHTPLPFAPFLCLGGLAVYLGQAHGLRFLGWLPALG